MAISRATLLSLFLFLHLHIALSSPPEDTVRCLGPSHACTVTNYLGAFPDRSTCKAGEVSFPTSEDDLIDLVATSTKQKRKMKVVTRYYHSLTKLACPEGDQGLLISTKYLTKIVGIDKAAMTMTVESGVTLEQLIKAAAGAGLALPHSPYWWGVTIGGLLSTGSHGSSLKNKGSAVHEYVTELRLVSPGKREDGYVRVRTLDASNEDLNAAKVSLGVLGVISQVTLQLQPLFKRAITYTTTSDRDLSERAVNFGNLHEFGDITWHPSQKKVVYRIDDRVSSANILDNGLYDYIGFRAVPSAATAVIRATEEMQEQSGNSSGKCLSGSVFSTAMGADAYGLTNNGLIFTGYPVVGSQDRLQSSGSCLHTMEDRVFTACGWDPRINGLFYHQTAFSIPLPKVKSFINDVQTLVSLVPDSLCGLDQYTGFLMRYIKASTAYLGMQHDSLDVEMTYYRSRDPMAPRLYEDVLEEVEQMGLVKYGGLPHWGKNRNLAFDGVAAKYLRVGEFVRVKDRYDPMGLFSSEWTDQMIGLKGGVSVVREGCALEGLCVCSKDIHCAPSRGYFCRPGKVYKEARVCTHLE